MARLPEVISFEPSEPGRVLELMASAASGGGWLNFEPEVPPEELPPEPSVLSRLFSASGPPVPLCTWTPPAAGRHRPTRSTIGVQHGVGERAMPRLRALGLGLPAGWVLRSDHPRRGLVIEVPDTGTDASVLDWLLAAGEALAMVPLTGRWQVYVHRS